MPSELVVRRVLQDDVVDFCCSDEDLSGFFRDDCLNYLRERLAVTYSIEFRGDILAMFSLCNDRLDVHDFAEDRKALKKAVKALPHRKRGMKHFPAVKIARLAVKRGTERKGLGTAIMAFIQVFFLLRNKTGCRFLTVDAYPAAIGFYERVGFRKVEKKDDVAEESDNTLMYLDLAQIQDSPRVGEMAAIVDSLIQSNRAEFNVTP